MSPCAEAGEMRDAKEKGLLLWASGLKHTQRRVFKKLLPGSAHIFHFKTMNTVIPNLW